MPSDSRVKKRVSNACVRCRQQKIRCSGQAPCEQCLKRHVSCKFDNQQQKVLVSRRFIADLERRATGADEADEQPGEIEAMRRGGEEEPHQSTRGSRLLPATPSASEIDRQLQSDLDDETHSTADGVPDDELENPLAPGNSNSYTADVRGKPVYLGATSNWSFGRRVLATIHERVSAAPLPAEALLFEGSTYDLGWNGQRSKSTRSLCALPTADFAFFLINAVKFHCQLFHLFDEPTFTEQFNAFHEAGGDPDKCSIVWYTHYLLLLAFGKSFMVDVGKSQRPAGASFFVEAMKILPDTTVLCSDPIQSVELLCCVALYLQCLDKRSAAYNTIGQAMRICVEQGMHTDIQSRHFHERTMERRREVWWTTYILDRHMSSLLGVPLSLSDKDISAALPRSLESTGNTRALEIHLKISRAIAVIVQTIYRKDGSRKNTFLKNIKETLKMLAGANDLRNESFPLDLKNPAAGISRISAYLHLFHHQCILLATRPLLFSLLQWRLNTRNAPRVSSRGGVRSLLRVCVSSAQQTLHILEVLQSQGLLDSFLPFDLDAAYSSALVLALTSAVDSSLLRSSISWSQSVAALLDEMVLRGNLVAKFHQSELDQIRKHLQTWSAAPEATERGEQHVSNANFMEQASMLDEPIMPPIHEYSAQVTPDLLGDWSSDTGLSGEQLMALADSLDFGQLDFLSEDILDPFLLTGTL